MPVIYGDQSIRPAPEVTIEKRFESFGDGRKLAAVLTATLTGVITTTKTADTESAIPIESRLTTTLAKEKALRDIFAVDGKYFEIQGYDGTISTKFLATVRSLNFGQGRWVDDCPYTIVLEGIEFANEVSTAENLIDSATESWSFEDSDIAHVYRVSHSLSAKGKTAYETDGTLLTFAWQRAKDFVNNKLKLGWLSTDSVISPIAGQTIWQNSSDFDATPVNVYNRILQENQDEVDGTYSIVETFILSKNNYTETLNVSVRRVIDEPLTTCIVSLSGNIIGLFVDLHDYETKLTNVQSRWAVLQPTLIDLANLYKPIGVTLNTKPSQGNFDTDSNNGIINFNYEFSDRKLINDTLETYSLDKKTTYQSPFITVSINGTIQGILYPGENDFTLKYTRALAQWNIVKLLLYARCLTLNSSLSAYPIDDSVTYDQINGSIGYAYTFDNRPNLNVIDEFTVSKNYTRESGRTDVTVSGTVTGLYTTLVNGEPVVNNFTERFNNAQTYWNTIKDNLLGRANTVGVTYTEVNPTAYSQEYSYNQYQGTVQYTYTWNNIPAPCVPGSLSEIITVTDDFSIPVIAIIGILGNGTDGPEIQDINSVTEKRRSVSFEVVMPVSYTATSTLICSNQFQPPSIDYSSYTPTGSIVRLTQNQQSWVPSTGRLTRTLAWVYKT